MISRNQLAEWERLADEATPGPWHENILDHTVSSVSVMCPNGFGRPLMKFDRGEEDEIERRKEVRHNVWFVVAAREAVPVLIARVRELEKDLDGLAHENTALWLQTKLLEKEADWMAKKASAHSPCIAPHFDCLAADRLNQCHICWREAARKAVKDD